MPIELDRPSLENEIFQRNCIISLSNQTNESTIDYETSISNWIYCLSNSALVIIAIVVVGTTGNCCNTWYYDADSERGRQEI